MRALLPAARRGADVRRAALLFAQTPHVSGTGERYAFRKRQEFRQEFPRKSKGEEIEKRRNEETKKRVCRVVVSHPPRTHQKHTFVRIDRSIDRSIHQSIFSGSSRCGTFSHTHTSYWSSLPPSLPSPLSLSLPSRLYLSHSIEFLRHVRPFGNANGDHGQRRVVRYRKGTPIGRYAV